MAETNNTAPQNGNTMDYQDKDLESIMSSPLLEDLTGWTEGTPTPPTGDAGTPPATPAADDATPPATAGDEATPPTDGTPSDAADATPPSTDAGWEATTDGTPTEEDDIMKIIAEIKTGDDAVAAASDEVDKAIESGNQDDIKKAYEALKVESQQKDDKVAQLMKELDRKNSDIAGLIDDKMTIEQSNKEKARIADVVMDSDDLKSLVAFTNKAQSDESYKAKVVSVLERMWEKYTGQSFDDLKDSERIATKSQMGENSFSTTTPSKAGRIDAPADLMWSPLLETL